MNFPALPPLNSILALVRKRRIIPLIGVVILIGIGTLIGVITPLTPSGDNFVSLDLFSLTSGSDHSFVVDDFLPSTSVRICDDVIRLLLVRRLAALRFAVGDEDERKKKKKSWSDSAIHFRWPKIRCLSKCEMLCYFKNI